MMPAAPTLILDVRAPICAVRISGALQARLVMLWCSETQYRRYPAASTASAIRAAPAIEAVALSPYSIPTKSSTASGSDSSMVSIVRGNALAARPHSHRDRPSLGAPVAGLPVFLDAGLAGIHAEAAQLGPFTQAALELGEAREAGQPDHVVPQRAGLGLAGQAADHRAEERHPGRRLELDDRRPDVLAGQRERLVGLTLDLGVERGVVQGAGQLRRQAGVGRDRLRRSPGAPAAAVGGARAGRRV